MKYSARNLLILVLMSVSAVMSITEEMIDMNKQLLGIR